MKKSEYILELKQIDKRYDTVSALDSLDLHFKDKKIYGLFGRNGSGKTTLLNIMASRILADRGDIFYFGENISGRTSKIAEKICYIPEKNYFPGRLKLSKLLPITSSYFKNFNKQYALDLCKKFNLDLDKNHEQLSLGQEAAFKAIIALSANAEITIFDEPTIGMDAVARDIFYLELIEKFSGKPKLFIISTHLIEESAELFNEAIIIKNGKVLRQGPIEELLETAFYVSGRSKDVENFIESRNVVVKHKINNMMTAVVEGNLELEKDRTELSFEALTIQKLFIYLTNDKNLTEL